MQCIGNKCESSGYSKPLGAAARDRFEQRIAEGAFSQGHKATALSADYDICVDRIEVEEHRKLRRVPLAVTAEDAAELAMFFTVPCQQ